MTFPGKKEIILPLIQKSSFLQDIPSLQVVSGCNFLMTFYLYIMVTPVLASGVLFNILLIITV